MDPAFAARKGAPGNRQPGHFPELIRGLRSWVLTYAGSDHERFLIGKLIPAKAHER
jgi:hypothetical protein